MKKGFLYWCLLLPLILSSCGDDDGPELPPVEERKEEAVQGLIDDLIAPANGWRVNYSPTSGAGTFLMLLDFNENGEVLIKSDVAVNDGEFREHVSTYRVDVGLSLELIFDTYNVFHYFFELNETQFGGEFEFLFDKRQGENLIFISKSDLGSPTTLTLEPADGTEESSFGLEIVGYFDAFQGKSPRIFGLKAPSQHVILEDQNISVFWQIDLIARSLLVDMAGEGTTASELLSNNNLISVFHESTYNFVGNRLTLENPFEIDIAGKSIRLESIDFQNFDSLAGPSMCNLSSDPTPVYSGTSELGNIRVEKSLFSSEGLPYQPQTDRLYAVNSFFIFDDSLRSLQEEGIISVSFPTAQAFVMNYGFQSDSLPENSVGLIYENEFGDSEWILQYMEPTQTEINRIRITLRNEFYTLGDVDATDIANMSQVNAEIFEGGEVYIYDWPNNFDLKIFWIYNPCNEYELLILP